MSIKVTFKKNIVKNKIKNYVLFSDENFKISGLNKISLNKDSGFINKTINNNKIKDHNFLTFNINSNQKITLIKLKNSLSSIEIEKIGANFYDFLKKNNIIHCTLLEGNFNDWSKKNQLELSKRINSRKLKSRYSFFILNHRHILLIKFRDFYAPKAFNIASSKFSVDK